MDVARFPRRLPQACDSFIVKLLLMDQLDRMPTYWCCDTLQWMVATYSNE